MAAALSAALGASQATAVDEREAQERLDAIGERIQAATQDLSATRDARDDANEDLREVETALAETHARLDALQAEKRDLGDDMRGRSEPVDTDPSGIAGHAEAAEADQSGTQQRRGGGRFELAVENEAIARVREHELGISAVEVTAVEAR